MKSLRLLGCVAPFVVLPSAGVAQHAHPPRFEDYPVSEAFTTRPAPVDLATAPGAQKYRTVLRRGAAQGPNFAGHYTVVQWGCGSPCKAFAIVDARTGRLWMPPIWMGLGASYRTNSALLIVDGPEFWADAWYSEDSSGARAWMPPYAHYYRWDGQRLQVLDSVQVTRPSGP